MRPNRLIVEGLTCFRDRQEVDFTGMNLFVITGPMGAGKSSLLEAMVFALYGELPRVNDRSRTHLISAGKDWASVTLDFNVGAERYQITRTLKRKGSGVVQLDKHDGKEFTENVADRVEPAKAKILQLLGLDATAFTQAVVLPQGKFAAFLQADPKDRREMLGSLLGVGVYERMRARAHQNAVTTKGIVERDRGLLSSEYQGVTPEALIALEADRAKVAVDLEALRTQRDDSQARLLRARDRADKTAKLQACERALEGLRRESPTVDGLRTQMAAAVRAAPLLPLIDEADRDARAVGASAEDESKARAALEIAQAELDVTEQVRVAAEVAAAPIADLRRQVEHLTRVAAQVEEAARLEARLERQTIALGDTTAALGKAHRDLEAAHAAHQAHGPPLEAARQQVRASGYDAELDALLDVAQRAARDLALGRGRATGLQAEEAKQRQRLQKAADALLPLEHAAAASQESLKEANRAWSEAKEAHERARLEDSANSLRERLEPGQPCPVCERPIDRRLPQVHNPHTKKAEKARDAAAMRVEAAEAKTQEAKAEVTAAKANLRKATEDLADAVRASSIAVKEVAQAEQELRASLGARAASLEGPVEVWIETQTSAVGRSRKAHARAVDDLHKAEQALAKIEAERFQAQEAIADREARRKAEEAEVGGLRHDLRELREKIAEVTGSKAPEAEAAAAKRKIATLEANLNASQAQAQGALSRLATAAEALKLRAQTADRAKRSAEASAKRRDEELSRAGFPTPAAVRTAFITDSALAQLSDHVARHDRDLHSNQLRAVELRGELGEVRVSREDLTAAEREAKDLERNFETHHRELTRLEEQVSRLREKLARSAEIQAELQTSEARLRVHERLAADLKTDRLQAFVLKEAFNHLVEGASRHLLGLTQNRYTLRFDDEMIWVVDHDNADEARLSATLSGGETFLASLSLALELSDHVQREAGLVHIDSLFIDEGFGSLDPEALQTASTAIQDLQVAGRMVGIITHIPELRDEFSQQILVSKHQGFSRVEVRRSQPD